jgi:hypothetical protein
MNAVRGPENSRLAVQAERFETVVRDLGEAAHPYWICWQPSYSTYHSPL